MCQDNLVKSCHNRILRTTEPGCLMLYNSFAPKDQHGGKANIGSITRQNKLTRYIRFSIQLQVHNAGHMVPMDQPKASLEMLRRFTQGKLKESLPESMVYKAVMWLAWTELLARQHELSFQGVCRRSFLFALIFIHGVNWNIPLIITLAWNVTTVPVMYAADEKPSTRRGQCWKPSLLTSALVKQLMYTCSDPKEN